MTDYLGKTGTFNNATPTWGETDITTISGWGGGVPTAFTVDAYSPRYIDGGSSVDGWYASDTQVQRITDIFGSPAFGASTAFTNTGSGRGVQMNFERGVANWGIITYSGGFGTDTYFTRNGTSWTRVNINGFFDTHGTTWAASLALSPHIAGRAYTSALLSTGSSTSGSPPGGALFQTSNYGASWSQMSISTGIASAGCIHVPYLNIGFDTIYHGYRVSASDWRLYKSIVGGASIDISPSYGGDTYGVDNNLGLRQIATCDADPNTMLFIGTSVSAGKRGVFLTRNAQSSSPTWSVLVEPAAVLAFPYVGAYIADRTMFYLFGLEIGASYDGQTVRSKNGNLTARTTPITGICGG